MTIDENLRLSMSRRALLRRVGVLGLATPAIAAVLAACGGSDSTATSASTSTSGSTGSTSSTSSTSSPTSTGSGGTPTGSATPSMSGTPGTAGSIMITGPYQGEAQELTGAGGTFPAVLYTKWISEYQKVTRVKINYQAIGSGGGIKSIQDQTVDFGASDGPMTDEQLAAAKGGPILHIPMTLGGVIPTYNIPEVEGKEALKFTPEVLSGIFLGTIKKWNDPAIVADNPSLSDVDKDIVVIHRSDGSGTTFIWTDYLSSVSDEWKSKVGNGTSVNWPVGLGGKGNEGVAGEVKQNPYSCGYVELIYALQNKLGQGVVKNKAGKFIEPTLESVTAAAAGAAANLPDDLRVSIVNADGDNSYPIASFTWILAYENMTDQAKAIALTRYLWWSVTSGQQYCEDLGYAPLPDAVAAKSQEKIKAITAGGKQAFPNA